MIATSVSETEALAHERTPLLCSPSPIISTGTSTTDDDDSEDLKPVETELGLPENDVACCAKSGHGEGSPKGFGGIVAVMLLGSLRLPKLWLFISSLPSFFCSREEIWKSLFNWWSVLVIRCLHLQCRQYPYPCHVGDYLIRARESWEPKLVGCVILLCHLRHPTSRMLLNQSANIFIRSPFLIFWIKEIDPCWPQSSSMENWAIYMAERPCWSPPICYLPSGPPYRMLWHIGWWRECWRLSSGVGRNLWEVVAARAVCGMGGAGMHVIVSILIAGIYCLALDNPSLAQVWCRYGSSARGRNMEKRCKRCIDNRKK